jgi:hypothetical protein
MRKNLCPAGTPIAIGLVSAEVSIEPMTSHAVLLLDYWPGTETYLDVILQYTPDRHNTTWYDHSGMNASGVSVPTFGTIRLNAAMALAIPLHFAAPGFFRLRFSHHPVKLPGGPGFIEADFAFGRT